MIYITFLWISLSQIVSIKNSFCISRNTRRSMAYAHSVLVPGVEGFQGGYCWNCHTPNEEMKVEPLSFLPSLEVCEENLAPSASPSGHSSNKYKL